jgi:hypothetical protein
MRIGGLFERVEVTPETQKAGGIITKGEEHIRKARARCAERMKSSRRSEIVVFVIVVVVVMVWRLISSERGPNPNRKVHEKKPI